MHDSNTSQRRPINLVDLSSHPAKSGIDLPQPLKSNKLPNREPDTAVDGSHLSLLTVNLHIDEEASIE